jgi:hypothetical protein
MLKAVLLIIAAFGYNFGTRFHAMNLFCVFQFIISRSIKIWI